MMFSVRGSIQRLALGVSVTMFMVVFFTQSAAYADPIPKSWQASNMKAIGYSDITEGNSASSVRLEQAG